MRLHTPCPCQGWLAVILAAWLLGGCGPPQKPVANAPPAAEPAPRPAPSGHGTESPREQPSSRQPSPKPEPAPQPQSATDADHPFPIRQPAPPLEGGTEWFNTASPLALEDLRGKFVLLDFWTYCCINCMHILPELERLEAAYPEELAVIGVHSAKFETEQNSQNIREAVLRYGIKHPVVNDAGHRIWTQYEVNSWPSLRVIDPEGNLVAGHSGEIRFEDLDEFFKEKLPYYREKGLLDARPLPQRLETLKSRQTSLKFPGKVLADEGQGRLYIADSSHHRIVVSDLEGNVQAIIGSGAAGAADGNYQQASFRQPQGMALSGPTLYVADTENHLLRKIDLAGATVTTLAGTGEQARHPWPGLDEFEGPLGTAVPQGKRWTGKPKGTSLNSPWALGILGPDLFIAMAGSHQIWRMPLDESEIGPYAGNGREDIVDGPLLPEAPYEMGAASFAQPSGLASDGQWLYVADSEGSSLRAVPLGAQQEVRTVIGTSALPGARLFVFGDRDGQGRLKLTGPAEAFQGLAQQTEGPLLQHPLDVTYYEGRLYVADTYNNKIKVVDPETQICTTLAGTGQPGSSNEPATFDEPAGITAAAGKLFVADTNNHCIRVIDLKTGGQVSTLNMQELEPPTSRPEDAAQPVSR